MTVDFTFATAPPIRVISLSWSGPWSDGKIRSQFSRLERWAREHGVRTGRWVMREPADRRWEVAIEVRGPVHGSGGVRAKVYPAARVARVVFDPEQVAPRVVYHGLSDWLRWRKKEKEIKSVVSSREVYSGNPWTDPKAWAHTEVQFVVRR